MGHFCSKYIKYIDFGTVSLGKGFIIKDAITAFFTACLHDIIEITSIQRLNGGVTWKEFHEFLGRLWQLTNIFFKGSIKN